MDFFSGFKRTLQKLRWHHPQDMPDLKLSMGDSTLHTVLVVAVVSEHQGENHFSLNQKSIEQPDEIGGLGRKAAPDEYPPSLMVDND